MEMILFRRNQSSTLYPRSPHTEDVFFLLIGSPVGFAGCSTTHQTFRKTDPETVLVTYHVKPGKEAEFQAALAQVWEVVPWKSETPLKSTTKNFNHPNG